MEKVVQVRSICRTCGQLLQIVSKRVWCWWCEGHKKSAEGMVVPEDREVRRIE